MCKFGTMRKAAAGIVAAAMLSVGAAGLVSTANAAEVNSNDITITQPAAVQNQLIQPTVNGRTFKAYRISNYSNAQVNADGKITGYDMKVTNGFTDDLIRDAVKAAVVTGDAINKNFQNVVTLGDDGNITFKGDAENLTPLQFVGKYFYGTGADVYGNENANSHQVRTFADYLLKHLPTGATAITGVGADKQVTLDIPDDEEGLYLIIEEPTINTTTDTFKGETVSRAMLTGTPIKVGTKLYNEVVNGDKTYTLGSLALKAEKVTLTKEIEGNDQLIQLNSVRTFTIRTNVPNYTTDYPNWQAKNFTIADNPSANINPFVTEAGTTTVKNLKVEATKADGTKATLAIGTDYTVDVTNSNSTDANDFKISLTDPTKWSGQGITITYDGVLTSTTPDGTTNIDQATVNDVQLDFSNNPNDPNEKATLTDQEKLFNAQLDMEKVAFNDKLNKLAGAKFAATVNGAPVAFTKSADGLTYTVNKDATAAGVTNEVVFGVQGADGPIKPITLDGLAGDTDQAVTYTFTETKAPEGYILGDNPVSFTVTVTPTFDAAGESTGAEVVVESANHANFIDLSEVVNATSPASTDGTVYTLGTVRVENTKNISDFAKTGGAIVWLMAAAGAAAAAGVGLGIAVRRSRSRRYHA